MLVLDTNVLSELMRPSGSPAVAACIDGFPPDEVFTTAINQAEILYGLAVMPKGRRRAELIRRTDAMFAEEFRGRILSFDERAAAHYAAIVAHCRCRGRMIDMADAQIAAISRAHGMSLVTRNVRHFADCGIAMLDPWQS